MAKTKRKRKSPAEVPVDVDGNVLREKHRAQGVVSGKDTFIAALALHEHFKYGSAYRLRMVDTASGKTYPVFAGDFLNMVESVSMVEGEILGEWGYCKKSSYFGVYLIQEIHRD